MGKSNDVMEFSMMTMFGKTNDVIDLFLTKK